MNNLSSLENLMIKQTCRSFAYKFQMGTTQTEEEEPHIYSLEFLKRLHDCPTDHISQVLKSIEGPDCNDKEAHCDLQSRMDKHILLDFFQKVNNMKSLATKQWNDLQHYLCFVYRCCMTTVPDPEQEILSPYFVSDMRNLVTSLMENDEIQLCLRMFAILREYTISAHKQHQKITSVEAAVERLFYYYEAFLSATKNICLIFPELEKLLLNTYKLGWLDLNTSIFMYYFYETSYVQNLVREFELMKNKASIKAAGIYTVLTELHKLWRTQMLGINGVIASNMGTKFKNVDSKMLEGHKKVLANNFWIDRSVNEKSLQDRNLFHYQLFSLVGDKTVEFAEPTLDEACQCICEDCLITKYRLLLENGCIENNCRTISCRLCKQQVKLDLFQEHINDLDIHNCRDKTDLTGILSNKLEIVKMGMTAYANSKARKANNVKCYQNSNADILKEPSPKIASEPPVFKPDPFEDEEVDVEVAKMALNGPDGTKVSRKTFYNFLKYRNSLHKNEVEGECDGLPKPTEKTTPIRNSIKQATLKSEGAKVIDLLKNSKSTNTSNKNGGTTTFPCGHTCKIEDELKSEITKAYTDTCDHHRDPKKCDCTFCEVFGTSSHVHKTNETRNRLRIRLNQRNEKVVNKLAAKAAPKPVPNGINRSAPDKPDLPAPTPEPPKTQQPPATLVNKRVQPQSEELTQDIHYLVNYIQGNTGNDKVAIAEKKAAKKARQREKKEQERLKLEEEERKKAEEEKRKLQERLRSEELARQLAERAKNPKKEGKKKKQQHQQKGSKGNNSSSCTNISSSNNSNHHNNGSALMEETIPAMVTIKRVVKNHNALPTVTITLKGSTPDQDKLLYTLVNGHDDVDASSNGDNKKSKKNKNQPEPAKKTLNLEVNSGKNNNKKKKPGDNGSKAEKNNSSVVTKELRVTLAVDSCVNAGNDSKKNTSKQQTTAKPAQSAKKQETKKEKKTKDSDIDIPLLRLPPGITITKVDGPMTDRNYKVSNMENPSYNSNIPVSKSGVIVVDTEKLIKQSNVTSSPTPATANGKKSKKKKNNKKVDSAPVVQNGKPSMVTLKNPIFQNMQPPSLLHNGKHDGKGLAESSNGQCQQASIFRNENGMVTIRSSRLQQSLTNGTPIPKLLSDLKPVLGPEVPTPFVSSCNFSETTTISPFDAQEILSGLPGIEITKVDKNAAPRDDKKACQTAEVSIIPTCNGDKFNFDKDDLHYENVFTPRDILEDDMDADERELEAFKRFCQQSIPPKRKEKVAHLNVKDIVLKKKSDALST